MNRQRGYIDLTGAFSSIVIFCIGLGLVLGVGVTVGLPWLWEAIKPWLHAITA